MRAPLPKIEPWTRPLTWGLPIETDRLILRPLKPGDAEPLFAAIQHNLPHLSKWLSWGEHYTIDMARQFEETSVQSLIAQTDLPSLAIPLPLLILWKETNEIIGSHGLVSINAQSRSAEMGYWVAESFTNIGIATESSAALITRCLTPNEQGGYGFNRVYIRHAGSNTASGAVPRKLGMRREGWERQSFVLPGNRRDDLITWGVLAEEWDGDAMRTTLKKPRPDVGVGPHPKPWPEGEHYDPRLLAHGDKRNVTDQYRYWTLEAIKADLAAKSRPFHVAVENWQHDMNIGTVVRCANAFGARAVHIVGKRSWNRRGAMVTDRYVDIYYHEDAQALAQWCDKRNITLIGVDLVPGSQSIIDVQLPEAAMLVFGQEGPGLTPDIIQAAQMVVHLPQQGSTRSINAGVAAGTAMMLWTAQHRAP
ncbi:GNAT family N-acetyltransferase [Stomatohabitans albus]|uniref:GNAT family N-acetyltransferase n=1 Tax=Stomatohabitans albus TaxID=3110766 RepID=UPI003AB98D49